MLPSPSDMKRILFVFLLGLHATACGSPDAPSAANIAGRWSGTFQSTQAGGSTVLPFEMTLTQVESSVAGVWSVSGVLIANGTVTGATTATTFSGTFTFNSTTTGGAACAGAFTVSGNAGSNTIVWTSPGVTANCSVLPTSITIAAQLR